ncbi:MFS transporter [uncultured Methanobrevibacter sp.]|uniref:MFS transporter n=1 Tax=uncultured Methanobrevibacter sp. TaxID=253161 RepID=UPI0025CD21F2|nr:MFS transporter [uncultured Methanobrevibacter sp.]
MFFINLNFSNTNWKSQTILILILTALVQLSAAFITNIITVMLPNISYDLDISLDSLNWISLIFLMAIISVGIPLNKCISQWGVKRCIRISIIGLMISLILTSIATNMELLLISRIIQGVTIAVMCISIYMMIILGIPNEHLGKTLGIVGSCGYIGTTIAPSIAGFISYYLSWRYAFLIIVPILVFELFLIYLIKDEWSTDKKALDIKGSLIYGIMVIFLVFGLSEVDDGLWPLIVGLFLLIIFIYYERKINNPIYNLNLIHNSNI